MSADHKWIVAVPGAERFRVRFGHSGSAGVVWPPTRVAAESLKTATDADLSLRRVYGYAGGVRHGLHFVSKSRLVYPVSGLCVGEDLHNHVWVEGVGGPHYGVAIPGEGVGGHVDINGSPTARVGPSPLVAAGGLGQAGGFPPPQAGNAGAAAPRKLKGNLGGDDAAAAAQHKKRRPKQRFFFGHSAEVTCLAYNKPRGLCASGQKRSHDGKEKPTVLVWRAGDFELIAALVFHERGICSLGFAPKGDILVSLGLDERVSLSYIILFVVRSIILQLCTGVSSLLATNPFKFEFLRMLPYNIPPFITFDSDRTTVLVQLPRSRCGMSRRS